MLPGFLHETGLITKAPTHKDTQDSSGPSYSGFINTTVILHIMKKRTVMKISMMVLYSVMLS